MRVIQGIIKKWNLSSNRLNDKGCNKVDLHSLKIAADGIFVSFSINDVNDNVSVIN